MIIHNTNEPALPKLCMRDRHWLHAHLSANRGSPLGCNLFKVRSTETIVEDLYGDGGTPGALHSFVEAWKKTYGLPKSEMDWISATHQRQLVWLLNELRDMVSTSLVDEPPHYTIDSARPYIPDPATVLPNQRYDIAIATIDAWPISWHQKRHSLNVIQQNWEKSQVHWRRTKWLNGRDEHQLNWAFEYVAKSNLWQKRGITFACRLSHDIKERHTYVLGFLDHLYKISEDFQELFITKMRKTWSQKKYRESEKAKKQVYFSLSDEARQHLRQLEKTRKQSRNHIIEDLLSRAVQSTRPR